MESKHLSRSRGVLNNEDDDCDGYIDADGLHVGELSFDAIAIYQGQAYNFSQTCVGSVERVVGQVVMQVQCEIDQSQERADHCLDKALRLNHLQILFLRIKVSLLLFLSRQEGRSSGMQMELQIGLGQIGRQMHRMS